jgi:hypothetical protein
MRQATVREGVSIHKIQLDLAGKFRHRNASESRDESPFSASGRIIAVGLAESD